MKILYCANKNYDSYLQLYRFLQYVPNNIEVRVAGYNGFLNGIATDYTLDSLYDYYGKNRAGPVVSRILQRYTNEIAAYNPDLIINDLDFFSSYAALELDIPYWLVSPFLFYFAISKQLKDAIAIGQQYRHVLFRQKNFHRYQFQIENAEKCLIRSYLGDVAMGPDITNGFEWVRPYYVECGTNVDERIGGADTSDEPNQARCFLGMFAQPDYKLYRFIQTLGQAVIYSPFSYEKILGIEHLDTHHVSYAENLRRAYLCFSKGETSFISDGFYHSKFALVLPDTTVADSVINAQAVEYFGLGEKMRTTKSFEQINTLVDRDINVRARFDPQIKQLHEYILGIE